MERRLEELRVVSQERDAARAEAAAAILAAGEKEKAVSAKERDFAASYAAERQRLAKEHEVFIFLNLPSFFFFFLVCL